MIPVGRYFIYPIFLYYIYISCTAPLLLPVTFWISHCLFHLKSSFWLSPILNCQLYLKFSFCLSSLLNCPLCLESSFCFSQLLNCPLCLKSSSLVVHSPSFCFSLFSIANKFSALSHHHYDLPSSHLHGPRFPQHSVSLSSGDYPHSLTPQAGAC